MTSRGSQFLNADDPTAKVIVSLLGGGYCLLKQGIPEDIPKTPQEIAAIMCNVICRPAPTDFLTA